MTTALFRAVAVMESSQHSANRADGNDWREQNPMGVAESTGSRGALEAEGFQYQWEGSVSPSLRDRDVLTRSERRDSTGK